VWKEHCLGLELVASFVPSSAGPRATSPAVDELLTRDWFVAFQAYYLAVCLQCNQPPTGLYSGSVNSEELRCSLIVNEEQI